MANYEFAVSTQHSGKVKNPQEVVDVFQAIGYEESYLPNNGEIFIGGYETPLDDSAIVFIDVESRKAIAVDVGDGRIINVETGEEISENDDFYKNVDDSKYESLDCMEYLQEQLLDGEVFALVEAGSEKLRFVGASFVVVTKKGIEWRNTSQMIDEIAKEMLEK